jgi:serine/threonine-protein phosphatase 2B regulatory subunit
MHVLIFQVTDEELRKLYRRFKKLDADNSGTITNSEFHNIPELASNPLLDRVIAILDANKDGEIQFSGISIYLSE